MTKLSIDSLFLQLKPFKISGALSRLYRRELSSQRQSFNTVIDQMPKKNAVAKPAHELCEYSIESGERYIRHVKPYFQDFKTFAKGRWIGREILEIFCREFGAHPPSYWINALRNGQVRINNKIVPNNYRIRNGDAVLHRTHRHEPPVFGEIVLVGETKDIVAISKPPSLPMHPCGAYRHNSLEYIMKREPLVDNQPVLSVVHRLDRVTSGLVVLAKSKTTASRISEEIRDKSTTKVYLARVKGRFPTHAGQVPYLRELSSINLAEFAEETEDYRRNGVQDDPILPSKRQLSDTENISVAVSDANQGGNKKSRNPKKDIFGKGEDIQLEDLPPTLREVKSKVQVGSAENVGVLFAHAVAEKLQSEGSKRYAIVQSSSTPDLANYKSEMDETALELWVKCPLGVISPRDGVHACDPSGKPSLSIFRSLGYCTETDTSLIECRPYTGRTHQLRLHLQLLGTPIANDPCYGGQLFYGDHSRRQLAIQAVREMREKGIIPLSKVPHFGDPAVDDLLMSLKPVAEGEGETGLVDGSGSSNSAEETCNQEGDIVQIQNMDAETEIMVQPRPGESEDDYLIRTCRYCQENSSVALEHLLHCDGIWLHALRYTGPPKSCTTTTSSTQQESSASSEISTDRWSFQAPYPAWATPFGFVNKEG